MLRLGGKNVKDVAGYGLIPLLVGQPGHARADDRGDPPAAPGTAARSTMLAFFPTLESAGDAVAGLTAAGLGPVTLELMDRFTIRAVTTSPSWARRGAAAMLLVESDLPGGGPRPRWTRPSPVRGGRAHAVVRAADAQEADWLRQGRRLAYRALEHLGVARMEDVGVPRSRVPEMLTAIEAIADRHGGRRDLRPCRRRHLTPRSCSIATRTSPRRSRFEAARDDLYEAALALGGVTGEHGIGVARREWLVRQRGEDAVAVMRAIKHALDPYDLLNPGRMLA